MKTIEVTGCGNCPFHRFEQSSGHGYSLETYSCGLHSFNGEWGYIGEKSPNRADAFIWAMSALFPGMVKEEKRKKEEEELESLLLNTFFSSACSKLEASGTILS